MDIIIQCVFLNFYLKLFFKIALRYSTYPDFFDALYISYQPYINYQLTLLRDG